MKLFLLIVLGFVSLHAKSFDEVLKSYLHNKLNSFEKIEFSVVQMPKNYKRIEINNEKNLKLVKNYAYVPVKIFDGRENFSAALITVRVKLYKTVLVTLQKINAGENLIQTMFESKVEDVSLIEGSLIEPKDLSVYRSKLLVREGTVLSQTLVELIPIVNKGEKVIVHSGKNGVDISLEAITREDGNSGDVIRVQASSKIFKAKVVDKYNLMLVE